jgi:1-acyl-sn-glycerol-3-phosphate acyltransferase
MFAGTRFQESPDSTATEHPGTPAPAGLLGRFRARRPGTALLHLVFYEFIRLLTLALLTLIYRLRAYGGRRIPRTGPVLLVANHQSYLDPPCIATSVHCRQLDFLARGGLFKFRPLGFLIRNLNAIPLREDGSDTAAIKASIFRLEQGSAVLIFPEGTRSPDGSMQPFKRGVAVLVKRALCPVVPVAIEGAYESWPRNQRAPSILSKHIAVAFGHPISHDELMALGPDRSLDRIADEIDTMRLALRRHLRRETADHFPPRGSGDIPRTVS